MIHFKAQRQWWLQSTHLNSNESFMSFHELTSKLVGASNLFFIIVNKCWKSTFSAKICAFQNIKIYLCERRRGRKPFRKFCNFIETFLVSDNLDASGCLVSVMLDAKACVTLCVGVGHWRRENAAGSERKRELRSTAVQLGQHVGA